MKRTHKNKQYNYSQKPKTFPYFLHFEIKLNMLRILPTKRTTRIKIGFIFKKSNFQCKSPPFTFCKSIIHYSKEKSKTFLLSCIFNTVRCKKASVFGTPRTSSPTRYKYRDSKCAILFVCGGSKPPPYFVIF